MSGTIVVNDVCIRGGRNVTIINGKVIVDGKDVTPDAKEVNISVTGNVEKIEVDDCEKITVTGDVGSVITKSGDVSVGGTISGSVQTISGDVDCKGIISGGVKTVSGDISSRR